MQTSVNESLDECRRVECRGVTRKVRRSVNESLNECRRMQTSVDKSKCLFLKYGPILPFCCCCNYAAVSPIGMEIFNFVVLSVIIAPHNVLTPHISKTHLLIVSVNIRQLELILKRPVKEKGRHPMRGECKPNSPSKALRFIK